MSKDGYHAMDNSPGNPTPVSPAVKVIREPLVIEFIVPAVPVAQPRQRHRHVKTKAGKEFVQNYTPKTIGKGADRKPHPVAVFKASVCQSFQAVYQGAPLDGPLRVSLVFVMPRLSSMVWKTKPMPRAPYLIERNDFDNLAKSTCDALNKLAWRDDGQIVIAHIERWYAAGDEQPHVEVRIERTE